MGKELKYFLESGGIFACWQPYCVATVLGSGVAVCLCDPVARIGGMNHFILPKKEEKPGSKYMTHFGNQSLPHLLDMMYKMGARRYNITAHIIGGAFSPNHSSSKSIGKKNIEIAKKYLKKNKIEIVNEDTGGIWGRKVLFNTNSGEIVVYKSKNVRERDWNGDKSFNYR